MLLADFDAYYNMHRRVAQNFRDADDWTRKSILNVARMGRFSSDRAVSEYASDIWQVEPIPPRTTEPRVGNGDKMCE
jgi:starch phosphorylase